MLRLPIVQVPPELAFGTHGDGAAIPPGAALSYEVHILSAVRDAHAQSHAHAHAQAQAQAHAQAHAHMHMHTCCGG